MKSPWSNSTAGPLKAPFPLGSLAKNPEKVEYVASRAAPSLDDIYKAVKDRTLFASPNVKKLFEKVITPESDFGGHLEQFNFGMLRKKDIVDAQKEGHEFIKEGLFQLPYPLCLFRVQVHFEEEEGPPMGMAFLLVDGQHPQSPIYVGDGQDTPGYACVTFTHDHNYMTAMHAINTLEHKVLPEGTAIQIDVPKGELEYWRKSSDTNTGKPLELRDIAEGALMSIGLTMILNTKNIRKDRCAPPAKPNKARAAAGRPLLPWVTRVYTDVYNRAVEPGEGTHASPRPHRRRAHVRHYPATPYREAYVKPIAAMLVNWDGTPLERGQYEVHGE